MRNFNYQDWEAFAGCESNSPLIGEFKVIVDGVMQNGVIVIDGKHMELYACDSNLENEVVAFLDFPTQYFAEFFAEDVLESKFRYVTLEKLEKFGFDVMP